jgi:Holliday junction resolvase
MSERILITKADGEQESFDENKLRESLRRAGADEETVDEVSGKIRNELVPGITTKEIYKHAFFLLRKYKRHVAARYSLKRAIMDMGPSGFPFEDYIAEIFKQQGFKTRVGTIVRGFSVEHEVDVIAENENKIIIVEAKFHNDLGIKSDLKVALYVKARIDDIKRGVVFAGGEVAKDANAKEVEGWIITNTRFTENAIKYATDNELKLLSWDYPVKGNLYDFIHDFSIHPLTSLTLLTKQEKTKLLESGVVLCDAIKNDSGLLASIGIVPERVVKIKKEASLVCTQSFA